VPALVVRRPALVVFFAAGLVFGMVEAAVLSYLPLYAVQALGFDAVGAGLLVACSQAGGAVSRLALGAASDRWLAGQRSVWLALIGAVGAIVFAGYAVRPVPAPMMAGGLAFAAMSGLMYLRSQNFKLAGVWFKAAGVALIVAALVALLRLVLSLRRRGWREGFLQRPFASVFSAASLLTTLAVVIARFQDQAKLQASLVAVSMIAVFAAIASFATYPVATFIALYRSYRESSTE